MIHEMHLNQHPFELSKGGLQTIESRLNDDKRRLLKIDDKIKFTNKANINEHIMVQIIDLHVCKNFKELYNLFPSIKFGGENVKNLLTSVYKYYSKEKEEKYGVIGIEFKLIEK